MLKFREATLNDMGLYFEWANDKFVRDYSFNSEIIDLKKHEIWFNKKLLDPDCLMLVFYDELDRNIGQVRFHKQNDYSAIIGVLVDKKYRGKGYSKRMIKIASDLYQKQFNERTIEALIKKTNIFSIKSFEAAGFEFVKNLIHENFETVLYIKKNENRKLQYF